MSNTRALCSLVLACAQVPTPPTPVAVRIHARLEFPTANAGEAKPVALFADDLDGDKRDELIAVTRGPGSLQVWSGLDARLAAYPEPRTLSIGDYALGPVAYGGKRSDRPGPQHLIAVAPRAQPTEVLVIDPARLLKGDADPIVRRIPLERRPRVLAAGDLLADGKPELAVADIDEQLLLFGATGEPVTLALGDSLPTCMLVLEDGSGIVVGFQGTRRVVLWTAERGADGRPVLKRGPMATLGGLPRDLDQLDVDGDGDPELVVAGGDEDVWIFGQASPGGIAAGLRAPPERFTTGAIPIDVEHRPIHGEGGAEAGNELCVLALNGLDYNLYQAAPEGLGATGAWYAGQSPVDAVYGDFDGDGAADLAIANTDAGRVSVLFSDGKGGLLNASFANTGRSPAALAAGDLDGDGFPEVVVLNAADGTLSIAKNKQGVLQNATRQGLAKSADFVQLADLDGDGALEAAYVSQDEGEASLTVLFGKNGQLFERAAFKPVPLGKRQGDLRLADVDGDGRIDVLATDPQTNRLIWLRNETEPGKDLKLGLRIETEVPSGPKGMAGLDAPSELAIALCGPGERTGVAIVRLEQDAQGAFAWKEISSINTTLPPLSLASCDLNGDGRRDLAILIAEKGADTKCRVLPSLRREDGNWDNLESFPVGYRPYRVVSADLDGDGRGEILVSAQNSHHVELWTGAQPFTGRFVRTADLGVHAGCLDVLLVDLDKDGRPEVVVANGFSNDLGVVTLR